MTENEFKNFLKSIINSKGKSLDKFKIYFKEPNEKKLKKKLLALLSMI